MAVSKRNQKKRHFIIPGTTLIEMKGFISLAPDNHVVAHYQMVRDPGLVIVGRQKVEDYRLVEVGEYENFDFENPVWRKVVIHNIVDTRTGDTRTDVVFAEIGLEDLNHYQIHGSVGRRARVMYKVNYHPSKGWRKRK